MYSFVCTSASASVLANACGPCIGVGFSPGTGLASLRSFNRNFSGRSGTPADQVYLASQEQDRFGLDTQSLGQLMSDGAICDCMQEHVRRTKTDPLQLLE